MNRPLIPSALLFFVVLAGLSMATPSHARHPYVRTWDQQSNQELQTCNNLATYGYYGRDNIDSLCRTAKQQDANHCNSIKGYPDYSETLNECKRLGK